MSQTTKPAHVDVLIIGAGLSGIGSAYHLRQKCPDKSFVIFEGRSAMGGTWDLFRYPGIRSDSDMYTLGYAFKPWMDPKAIADGPTIREYIVETARENRIDSHIRFDHKVVSAEWDDTKAHWLVTAERADNGDIVQQSCNFLMMCSGYYNYDHGYKPDFEGEETFEGKIVHPQHWSEDIDYAGKKVVVIGSGATAVTLVPEMAKQASKVTMLQRSPSYVVSRPSEDRFGQALLKLFPKKAAYAMTRWKNVILQRFFFNLARSRPEKIKQRLISMVREELGPDFDVEKHFTPKYNPWDQRLCVIPDSDLFNALQSGRADIATDHIERFDKTGILLKSGEHLDADLVVTATGLDLAFLGKVSLKVNGKAIQANNLLSYKGIMYSEVPNMAAVFGYTNASWTLKADLSAEFMCRLLNHMDKTNTRKVVPVRENKNIELAPWLDFSSGYVQRSLHKFPKQATSKPWRLNQDYTKDLFALRFGKLDDGALTFSHPGEKKPSDQTQDISRSTNTVPAE